MQARCLKAERSLQSACTTRYRRARLALACQQTPDKLLQQLCGAGAA